MDASCMDLIPSRALMSVVGWMESGGPREGRGRLQIKKGKLEQEGPKARSSLPRLAHGSAVDRNVQLMEQGTSSPAHRLGKSVHGACHSTYKPYIYKATE